MGKGVEMLGHLLHGIVRGRTLQDGQDFFVGKAPPGADDGRIEFSIEDAALLGQKKLDAFGQAIDAGFKRAKLVA